MNVALAFTRVLFILLNIFTMTFYMISGPGRYSLANLTLGAALGLLFSSLLIGFDLVFKKFNLRSFNIVVLGLFFGYLMGQAIALIFSAILDISAASTQLFSPSLQLIRIAIFLFSAYLGTLMTLRASDEIHLSIPFVKFTAMAKKKKDLLVDSSLLADKRVIDLAASGLLDGHLVLPRFVVKDLSISSEIHEEQSRLKTKRSLDVIKKLEEMPELELRYSDTDFPEMKDPLSKMIRLARLLDANILIGDSSQTQIPSIEGVRFININDLSKALKPLMQTGEHIKIKIQRYGKEPRQGVGYLDDGTMVVVNGGGDFLGDVADAQVLSVKHTASGRMIFCNAFTERGYLQNFEEEHEEH